MLNIFSVKLLKTNEIFDRSHNILKKIFGFFFIKQIKTIPEFEQL